jgi:UDP-N-acetyl-D-glucosamine dehydrogenase
MIKEKVAVIGLGYVGWPLASRATEKGFEVIGIDIDQEKIASAQKEKFRATDDFSELKGCSIVVVAVPTPVDHNFLPDFKPLKKAVIEISSYLHKGMLVLIESTINPGVCNEIILPLLEKSGLKIGKDFYLAHCPERIDPGNPIWRLENIPRVLGADDPRSLKKANLFYREILAAPIKLMNSFKEAEAVKIVENTFRDINIAFVNELAQSFDRMGIDLVEVLKGASTKPFGFMPFWPGCGVGGHCIPVDPYYLINQASQNGFDHRYLRLARTVNQSMPAYTIDKLMRASKELKIKKQDLRVGLFGLAYKKDVADLRESPALIIKKILQEKKINYQVFDPYFPKLSTARTIEDLLSKVNVIILSTDHQQFVKLPLKIYKENRIKIIIDGRNALNKEGVKRLGILYQGIGC